MLKEIVPPKLVESDYKQAVILAMQESFPGVEKAAFFI